MANETKTVKKSAVSALEQMNGTQPIKVIEEEEPDIVAASTLKTVTVEVKSSGDSEYKQIKNETKDIEQKFFYHNPPRVFTDYARTINMGNYESAKISVGLSIPIGIEIPDDLKKQILEGHKWATDMIGAIVAEEEQGIRQYLKEQKK